MTNSRPGPIRLLIFDWDGTLMDSANKIVTCFQAAARDCDLPVPGAALVEQQIGLTLEIAWSNILPVLGERADPILAQRASDRYRDYFLEIDQTPMPLYDGVVEGIQQLEENGYLLAIATGKARRGLERALQETDLRRHFVYSRCADEAFSKPHPKMLHDILEFCGCEAHEALMVGDTTYDMDMARHASMDSLAVSYGVHKEHVLTPLASLGCAVDFADVLCRIEQGKS
ncbi:MAG: HAD-IA family hydrolase [Proteobacteria bacterium]|nr:HAD-IA family hydrolase [Pseudomonadota bacterium]